MARKSKKTAAKDVKAAPKKSKAKSKAPDAPMPDDAPQATPEDTVGEAPTLRILAQYVKDASFENPAAPASLRSGQEPPTVDLNIGIGRQVFEDNSVEVVLGIKAVANRGGQPVFLAEVEYAGLFAFAGANMDTLEPMIAIECPRLLFPSVRQIIAQMTMDGGFYPPLRIDPPDFVGMFRDEMMRRAQAEGQVN